MAYEGIFSKFTDDLLPRILSCLTLKQRATTSLVSKKWYHMITSLDDRKFVQIDRATKYSRNFSNVHPIVKLATNNTNLTEFYLIVPFSSAFFEFSFFNFDSRLLTVLHLKLCIIYDINISWFPCLKEIYFDRVHISSTNLSKLITKCPSIIELTLIRCCNLYSIIVPHQNRLKKVYVNYDNRYLEKIEIKARNLMEFHLFNSSLSLEVDLRACTKLQILELDCQYIPIGFPEHIPLEFPCLKSLSLCLFKKMKNIKLLSHELENLTLSDVLDLDNAIIDIPNLCSFKLMNMEKVPSWRPLVGSKLMEVEIGLKNARTTNTLLELRRFVENLGENITLSFHTTELKLTHDLFATKLSMKEVISHSGNLRSKIEPLCIKHMTLEVLSSLVPEYHESFIDELFSYFHPRTFLVSVDSDVLNCNFRQVLLDELKGRKTKCSKRNECRYYMCWRNALKSFEILESTTTTKEGAHQLSFEFHWYLPYKGQSLDRSRSSDWYLNPFTI